MSTHTLVVVLTLMLGAVTGQTSKTEHGVVMTFGGSTGNHIGSFSHMPYYENGTYIHWMSMPDPKSVYLSVDSDSRTNTLYLYDYYNRVIVAVHNFNISMNSGNEVMDLIHAGTSKRSVQVAYDWLSQVLYWTDATFNWIVAAPGKRELIPNGWYKIIVQDHLTSPDGIAVDPLEGLLFWTDTYVNQKIERSDLDGSNRATLFTRDNMYPASLEVDHSTKKIFWTDWYKNAVECANYDGTGMVTLKQFNEHSIFDIAIFKDVIMVSSNSYNVGVLQLLNKTDGTILATTSLNDYNVNEQLYGLGIYNQDSQPLRDKDYCAALNCSQMCITTRDGAKCACSDGYELKADSRTCENVTGGYHRAIVLSTDNEICISDVRAISAPYFIVNCIYRTHIPDGTSQDDLTHGKIRLLDINMADRIIYFATESGIFRIAVDAHIQNNRAERVLDDSGTNNITGLVYDWINPHYLYWCTENGVIYSTNVQQMKTTVILSSAGKNTKDLILLPHERMLAWLSGYQLNYTLKTMYLDGSNIKTIASDLKNPTGLNRDQENKRIYMVDEGTIKRVAYNETGPPLTFINTTGHDIIIYKTYFVIMGTVNGSSRFDSYNRRSLEWVNSGHFWDGRVFTDVKVLDERKLQPNETGPCHHENGGCEQICTSSFDAGGQGTLKCSCSLGYTIDPVDKSKCTTGADNDIAEFLLVTDWLHNAIYLIDLQTESLHAVDVARPGTPTCVIYNPSTRKIVFDDMYDTFLYQANLDGTDTDILVELGTFPNRMDLDESTGNIYYTSSYDGYGIRIPSHVGIITPSGRHITLGMDLGILPVRDIVLHPGIGRLFFSAYSSNAYIAMANMDGSNKTSIIQDGINGTKVNSPYALALDFTGNKLYWSDVYSHTINECGLNGGSCSVFISDPDATLYDIVVDGKYLYYLSGNYITRVLLSNSTTKKKIAQHAGMVRLSTMFIYKSTSINKQPVNEYCKPNHGLGDCSTICLPTSIGRTCACDSGGWLNSDGRTCSNVRTVVPATTPVATTPVVTTPVIISEKSEDDGPVVGLGVTVAVLAIVIVGMIVALVFFRRKLWPNCGPAGVAALYSRNDGDGTGIAISNRGYAEFQNEQDTPDGAQHDVVDRVDRVDRDQLQPYSSISLPSPTVPGSGIVKT